MVRNPLPRSLVRVLLADARQVFGRDEEFARIVFHWLSLWSCRTEEFEKLLEERVGMAHGAFLPFRQHLLQNAAEAIDAATQQRMDNLTAIGEVLFLHGEDVLHAAVEVEEKA